MDVLLMLRVVVSLAAVFGALFFLHRWVTKGRPGTAARVKQIQVVARQGLGTKAGVAVVEAGGRRYLLGVTEHAVTILDTFGEAVGGASEPTLVEARPIELAAPAAPTTQTGVVRFEQELRTITIATRDVPVVVHGHREVPTGPMTEAVVIAAPQHDPYTTRRALRRAEQQQAVAQAGPLAGSVLSPATWRQTFDAVKRLR